MGSIPAGGEEKFRCPNMLSSVSFAGMTLNKCAVLRIGTLTGGPLCRLKNPTVVYMITCRLSSCKTGVYNIHLLIILERGCSSMFRKKERLEKEDRIDEMKKNNSPPVPHLLQAQQAPALPYAKVVGRPGTGRKWPIKYSASSCAILVPDNKQTLEGFLGCERKMFNKCYWYPVGLFGACISRTDPTGMRVWMGGVWNSLISKN